MAEIDRIFDKVMSQLFKGRRPPKVGNVNETSTALKFVNRERAKRVFENAVVGLNASSSSVRVFYGAGGQGKTKLCDELIRWSAPENEPSFAHLKRCKIAFQQDPQQDENYRLIQVRNVLAQTGIKFPRFDHALDIIWKATRRGDTYRLDRPALKNTKAAADGLSEFGVDSIKEYIAETIGTVPLLGPALKKIFGAAIDKGSKIYVEVAYDEFELLYRDGELKGTGELWQLLPKILAADLRGHLNRNPDHRFVLFLDEYDTLFEEGGARSRQKAVPFDRYLQTLINSACGLLVVFFLRERLFWESEVEWREKLVDAHYEITGLTESDSDEALRNVPIEDEAVRRAIISNAKEGSGDGALVYPLMIEIQVAQAQELRSQGKAISVQDFTLSTVDFIERRRQIVARILYHYGESLQWTLMRLSVVRRFDEETFSEVARSTGLPADQFDRIRKLSFVRRDTDGFCSIHNVIAETIRETMDDHQKARFINEMFLHFQRRSVAQTPAEVSKHNLIALSEAAALRIAQGIEGYVEWLQAADATIAMASEFATLTVLWREALSLVEMHRPSDILNIARCHNQLGTLLRMQADFSSAQPHFERALEICEGAWPREAKTATCFQNLGSNSLQLKQGARALGLLEKALVIHHEAVDGHALKLASCLHDYASALQAVGQSGDAIAHYERALQIREQDESCGPEHSDTATTLNDYALLIQRSSPEVAERSFERALAIRSKIFGMKHLVTAESQSNLATFYRDQGNLERSEALFNLASSIYLNIGARSPERARCLADFATLLEIKMKYPEARALLETALSIYEEVLVPLDPATIEIQKRLRDIQVVGTNT